MRLISAKRANCIYSRGITSKLTKKTPMAGNHAVRKAWRKLYLCVVTYKTQRLQSQPIPRLIAGSMINPTSPKRSVVRLG